MWLNNSVHKWYTNKLNISCLFLKTQPAMGPTNIFMLSNNTNTIKCMYTYTNNRACIIHITLQYM